MMRRAAIFIGLLALAACNGDAPKTESTANAPQAEGPAVKGKAIFQQNCATCHMLKAAGTGPALAGALARWNGDSARLRAYIRNPAKLIQDGDPEAVKAFEAYKPTVMTPFPALTDAEVNSLIAYFESGQ